MICEPYLQARLIALLALFLAFYKQALVFQARPPHTHYVDSRQQVYKFNQFTGNFSFASISSLSQGDRILTLDKEGFLTEDVFIGFLYSNSSARGMPLMDIRFECGKQLLVSEKQLLADCITNFLIYREAQSFRPGDVVCRVNIIHDDDFMGMARIKSITSSYSTQVSQLMTASGTFLISDLAVSAQEKYSPNILYLFNLPYRWLRVLLSGNSPPSLSLYPPLVMHLLDRLPTQWLLQ